MWVPHRLWRSCGPRPWPCSWAAAPPSSAAPCQPPPCWSTPPPGIQSESASCKFREILVKCSAANCNCMAFHLCVFCTMIFCCFILYSFFSRFRSTAILYFINFPFHNITVLNADITFPPGSRCRPLPLWRTWHPQPLPPCHAVPLPLLLGQDNYRPVSDIWRGSKSVCVWRM